MNQTSKTLIGLAAVVVLVGGVYLATRPTMKQTATTTTGDQNTAGTETTGTVVYSVTDAAVNMGNVTAINLTASQIQMHSATKGWITVSNTAQTFNLLDLNAKNQTKLLASISAPTGTYDQVRLSVDKVVVKTKDAKTMTAKLPSGMLTINTTVNVKDGMTTSVHFDFLASKSLHMTGKGEYIFAPVVKVESKSNADVAVDSNSVVTFGAGNVDFTSTSGMDLDGSVKANFELNDDKGYDIVNDVIRIHGASADSHDSAKAGAAIKGGVGGIVGGKGY